MDSFTLTLLPGILALAVLTFWKRGERSAQVRSVVQWLSLINVYAAVSLLLISSPSFGGSDVLPTQTEVAARRLVTACALILLSIFIDSRVKESS